MDNSGSKSSNMPHAPCESGESFQWLVHNTGIDLLGGAGGGATPSPGQGGAGGCYFS